MKRAQTRKSQDEVPLMGMEEDGGSPARSDALDQRSHSLVYSPSVDMLTSRASAWLRVANTAARSSSS